MMMMIMMMIVFRAWVSDNEAKVVDSSKLACYINDTNTIGQYILEPSDCSSLTTTLLRDLQSSSESWRIIDHYLPAIIIGVSVLIIISVALVVFIYYR